MVYSLKKAVVLRQKKSTLQHTTGLTGKLTELKDGLLLTLPGAGNAESFQLVPQRLFGHP